MRQKKVWITCGIPGSGKSTWVQQQLAINGGVWCSRDKVRFSLLKDEDEYFSKEDLVFSTWVNEIQSALNDDNVENIYIDATHLNKKAREKVLNKLNLMYADLIAVNFIIPIETCIERNSKRTGRALVPKDVIESMYKSFRPAVATEGYLTIINITE